MLDTKALAADRASKTISDISWQLGVKRDCHNSVISGYTEHSMAKINDNLVNSLKCGKKGKSKTAEHGKQLLVYSCEKGLIIVSWIITLMTEWIKWMSKIASPQQCSQKGNTNRNLIQLTLHMLTVFPLVIENCVEGTTRWPLQWRDTHYWVEIQDISLLPSTLEI